MMIDRQVFRINNFDLLRLIAALQVALNHAIEILEVQPSEATRAFIYFTYLFPGVPIFFFISGFLISKSFESNSNFFYYIKNRMLRLFPGLLLCVSLSFVLIYASGYMHESGAGVGDWITLYIAKTTIFQSYNPDFMRAYGDGVLNGSLWTVTVEIQFYLLVPVLYSIIMLWSKKSSNYILLLLIVIFLIINRIYTNVPDEYQGHIIFKLTRISFLPWFYMFLVGVFVQRNFEIFYRYLVNKFVLIFVVYLLVSFVSLKFNLGLGNNVNPVVFLLLAITSFSFSYSYIGLSQKILNDNDISYGVYIYHMPIVNLFVYTGVSGQMHYVLFALLITFILSLVSWRFVEKKCLRLKKKSIHPIGQV